MDNGPEAAAHLVLFWALAVAFGATPTDGERIASVVLDEMRAVEVNADSAMQAVARIKQLTDDTL